MTTAPIRIGIWTVNGGTDPRTRHCTPRKFRGPGAEAAVHFDNIRAMRPSVFWFHLYFGTRNPADMEADSYPSALYGARELDRLTRVDEFIGANLALWEYGQFYGLKEMWFYEGQFRASPYMQRAWDTGRMDLLEQRIVTSMKPYRALQDRGVNIRVIFDAMCNKAVDSLDAHGLGFVKDTLGLPVGIETRPHTIAAWANRADIPCITERGLWHRMNPEVYADSAYAIPNGELKGEQWVIVVDDPVQAEAEIQAGRSVAYSCGNGPWVRGAL